MPSSLKDQVVLITGASSGFGHDSARLFAREGCIVILAARRTDRLTTLAEEINSSSGRAFAYHLDISDTRQVEEFASAVLQKFGHVDILFNNAGFGRLRWLEKQDFMEDIKTQIDTNLTGLIQLTRLLLPSMLERRSGHIINMSSIAGWIGAPLYTLYNATKFGVRGFTDALRREVILFGIKVSCIYPGPAATEFGRDSGAGAVKVKLKPPDWMSMPSEYVARKVVWLAKHPRRQLILPWYYGIVNVFDFIFPGVVDWAVQLVYVKGAHKL